MSKSSIAAVPAQQQQQQQSRLPSTNLHSRSAWAKGPPGSATGSSSTPQNSTPNASSPVSTPRSQSPHPSHQTHSRRTSSSFGIGVPTVNVPRSFGQAATGAAGKNNSSSPVTFGSIDQPNVAPTPASPQPVAQNAAAAAVKTFGSIPSSSGPNPVVNGKPPPPPVTSTPSPAPSLTAAPTSGSSTPPATVAKPRTKVDIKKFFQGSGSLAPSPTPTPSQPPPSQNNVVPSPTPGPVPLPHNRGGVMPQSYPPYSPSPSSMGRPIPLPLSPHPHPASLPPNPNHAQNATPSHHQQPQTTPRSPSFNRQMSNGKGSNGPVGNNNTTPPNTSAPHSPRLIPQGPGPGVGVMQQQPTGPPGPAGMPMGQMQMQGMPQQVWPQYYYSPYTMSPQDPNQPHVHPNQHPHHQHPHPQHAQYMSPPPQFQGMTPVQWLPAHMQQHHHPQHSQQGTPPQHLHPLPGGGPPPPTPQSQPSAGHSPSPHLAHAQPHLASPRMQPPPLTTSSNLSTSHPASPAMSSPSISLPPPTPNQGTRMNHGAAVFTPRAKSTIVIKDASGNQIDLTSVVHKRDSSISTTPTPISEKRRSGVVRMETAEDKRKREEKIKEEERKQKEEEEKVKKEAEEKERLKIEAEEKERIRKEEEEKERIRKEEEEKERIRKEEERIRKEEEQKELERIRIEEEAKERERIRLEEEEKERLRKEEEEKERLRKEEEERIRIEEAAKREREAAEAAEAERLRLEKEKEEAAAAVAATEIASKPSITMASPLPPLTPPTPASTTSTSSKRRPIPGPLDLTSADRPGLPPPLPSALATARIIKDLEGVSYPEGIMSPKIELNKGAVEGKFKYDRDFLLQFMRVCKEKPDNLPPLDAIGLDRSGDDSPASATGHAMTRTRSDRHRASSQNMGPPGPPNRAGTIGLGIPINQFGKNQAGSGFRMGEFAAPPIGNSMRHVTGPAMQGGANVPYGGGGKPPLVRTSSQGGPNGIPGQGSGLGNRKRGSRTGSSRTEATRINQQGAPTFGGQQGGPQGLGFLEPVAPLETTANRWQAGSVSNVGPRRGQPMDDTAPEIVDKKVKGLLNKLTMERFDSISDQIIDWANKSEKETDGRTLMRVIRLVFEKATDEATWSEMYARLCRKMLEKISTDVVDESIKTPEGKPFAGGQLFRKYLLNRCQEDFERGWQMKEATVAAAAAKAADDSQAAANEEKGEEALYSEEYYAAQKAKRQGLGLVKFIGELFKLQMLTERIMHECIKKLLSNVENPAEEEIESLCKLLSTVGQQLDNQKAKNHMDVYFTRMKELASSTKIASRMQYMLVDVIELRERRWMPRNAVAAPSTIAAVHEQAAREKVAAEKESYARPHPMSRGGSRRGEMPRGDNPDGWTTAGGGPSVPVRPPAKVGDMSKFGQITKGDQITTFRPSGAFKKEKEIKRESASLSRTSSNSNMYAMLRSDEATTVEPSLSRGSQPPSRKPSADFTQSGLPEGMGSLGRKRIQLLPRSKPTPPEDASEGKGDKTEEGAAAEAGDNTPDDRSESEPEEGEIRDGDLVDSGELPPLSEADAQKKVKEDVKELFSIRNLEEADEYFRAIHPQHHALLVEKIVAQVLDLKEADARFIASFFEQVAESELCASTDFETGFGTHMEILDDISVDVPAAYKLVAILLQGTQLPRDSVERLADKIVADGEPLVPPRQKLLAEFDNVSL